MLRLNLNERADSVPNWLAEVDVNLDTAWAYPDNAPYEAQLAEFWGIEGEQVLLTNGGDEAISLLFRYAQSAKRRVVIPLPMFSQYDASLTLYDVEAKLIAPLSDLSIDSDSVLRAIQPNDIVILTTPNNPTGEVLSSEVINTIANQTESAGATLFLDEAYCDFSGDTQTYLPLLSSHQSVMLLRTFSKAYGLAGARLGYVMGTRDIVDALRALSMPFNVSTFALQLLPACLSTDAQQEISDYCQRINQNRDVIANQLSVLGFSVFDGKGNFIFCKGEQNRKLFDFLYARNLLIKVDFVGIERGAGKSDLSLARITIPDDITALSDALSQFSEVS